MADHTRPCRPSGSRSARGFTLLEILLSLGLLALLASVLVGTSARMLSDQPATPHEIFWKAVQEARKAALKAEHDIRLKFDKDKKQFVLIDGLAPATLAADGFTKEETPLKTFPIPIAMAGDLQVDLLGPAVKGGHMILVAGVLMETTTLQYITFYSDGTCAPFRAQFTRNGVAGSTLAIDPWTCAPVLTPSEQAALAP